MTHTILAKLPGWYVHRRADSGVSDFHHKSGAWCSVSDEALALCEAEPSVTDAIRSREGVPGRFVVEVSRHDEGGDLSFAARAVSV